MDGHNRRSMGRNSRLYLIGIHIARLGVNIHKNGFDTIPPQSMCGGNKRIGRGYHLTRNAQGLESRDEGKGAVGKYGDIVHTEIAGKRLLQLFVERAIVGNPFAVPNLLQVGDELIQRRKKRGGNGNWSRHNADIYNKYTLTFTRQSYKNSRRYARG